MSTHTEYLYEADNQQNNFSTRVPRIFSRLVTNKSVQMLTEENVFKGRGNWRVLRVATQHSGHKSEDKTVFSPKGLKEQWYKTNRASATQMNNITINPSASCVRQERALLIVYVTIGMNLISKKHLQKTIWRLLFICLSFNAEGLHISIERYFRKRECSREKKTALEPVSMLLDVLKVQTDPK